jgi:ABC-2 type transport system permease protein
MSAGESDPSSAASWRSTSTDITPSLDLSRQVVYTPEGEQKANTLAVMVEGRFESFFDESPLAQDESEPSADEEDVAEGEDDEEEDVDTLGTVTTVIDKSPESARLVVIGSASFVADQTVRMIGSADGMIYGNSNQLMANLVDWAVEDRSLLGIRARGHFNRTLEPMETDQQRVWEYVNYALALAGLALVFGLSRQRRLTRRNTFKAQLEASS